jgi:hypothetical protein
MLTRSQKSLIESFSQLKSRILSINQTMNLTTLYYNSDRNYHIPSIIKLCLNDEQLSKINKKRIIIYNNNNYDYAELISVEVIPYNKLLCYEYNKNHNNVLESIDNNLLDDVIVEMLLNDDEIQIANVLIDIKNQ